MGSDLAVIVVACKAGSRQITGLPKEPSNCLCIQKELLDTIATKCFHKVHFMVQKLTITLTAAASKARLHWNISYSKEPSNSL
jgi:hypothetical protein